MAIVGCHAMALFIVITMGSGCSIEPMPLTGIEVYVGEQAEQEILARDPARKLDGCTSFYFFHRGGIGKSVEYLSCDFESDDDCWDIVHAEFYDGAKSEFGPWVQSEYPAIALGPAYFGDEYRTSLWDVTTIRHGLLREVLVENRHRKGMDYCVIDIDRKRLYISHWTDFPTK
jgi:hypothetical protein